MRKALYGVIIVAAAIVSLVSCNTSIAKKRGLPEDPVASISTELSDTSRIFTDQYLDIMYTGFTLSDADWSNYLNISASVELKIGTPYYNNLSVYELNDGSIFCIDTMRNNRLRQDTYTITLNASDGSLEDTFTKDFMVGTGDGSYLSLRDLAPSDSTSQEPWLCSDTPVFEIAISDDKASVFIRPLDDFGAACNFSGIIYQTDFAKCAENDVDHGCAYILSIPHSSLETGKWTRLVALTDMESMTSSDAIAGRSVDYIRSEWSFKYWATTQPAAKDWGETVTTYGFGANFTATEPAAADVIELSANMARAASPEAIIYSPILKRQLGRGK